MLAARKESTTMMVAQLTRDLAAMRERRLVVAQTLGEGGERQGFGFTGTPEEKNKLQEEGQDLDQRVSQADRQLVEQRQTLDVIEAGLGKIQGLTPPTGAIVFEQGTWSTDGRIITFVVSQPIPADQRVVAPYAVLSSNGEVIDTGYVDLVRHAQSSPVSAPADSTNMKTVDWARAVAEEGSPEAAYLVGAAYEHGSPGYPQSDREAAVWYQRAAAGSYAPADYALGRFVSEGRGGLPKDVIEAVNRFRRAAERDYGPAEYELGRQCESSPSHSDCGSHDAAGWYLRAAEHQYPPAEQALSRLYSSGSGGVPENPDEALQHIERAIALGDNQAMNDYLSDQSATTGFGFAQDTQRALEELRQAALAGNVLAQSVLGSIYAYGRGVEKDPREAVQWFQKAAAQGHAQSQYELGRAYEKGLGVPIDGKQALEWYQKAATQGHVRAQYMLGLAYERGQLGVQPNLVTAEEWYRRAWRQHYLPALARLVHAAYLRCCQTNPRSTETMLFSDMDMAF